MSAPFRPPVLFPLGQVVSTPGALDAVPRDQLRKCLLRHRGGDWGTVCDEDKVTNNEAARVGNRILSAYPIDPNKPCAGFGDNCFWIITEADRSVTTFLLPSEY